MLQDPNVERYVENAIKPLKKEITKLKVQIEELNKALRIHDVVGRSEQFYCTSDKDNRYDRCEEQCHLCKMGY